MVSVVYEGGRPMADRGRGVEDKSASSPRKRVRELSRGHVEPRYEMLSIPKTY